MIVGVFLIWVLSYATGINFWVLTVVLVLGKVIHKFYKIQNFPLADCTHCDKGRQYHADGVSWRDCNWCGGAGYRVQWGGRERPMGWARNKSGLRTESMTSSERMSRRTDVDRTKAVS